FQYQGGVEVSYAAVHVENGNYDVTITPDVGKPIHATWKMPGGNGLVTALDLKQSGSGSAIAGSIWLHAPGTKTNAKYAAEGAYIAPPTQS
ncbi:MAG: hypothetical protein AAF570_03890, partial [Bacteroidota bacterium]